MDHCDERRIKLEKVAKQKNWLSVGFFLTREHLELLHPRKRGGKGCI